MTSTSSRQMMAYTCGSCPRHGVGHAVRSSPRKHPRRPRRRPLGHVRRRRHLPVHPAQEPLPGALSISARVRAQFAKHRGRTGEVRVGLYPGGFWMGCCWALMTLLLAFRLMNVAAMVVLAGVVLEEKTWRWGPDFRRPARPARAGVGGGCPRREQAGARARTGHEFPGPMSGMWQRGLSQPGQHRLRRLVLLRGPGRRCLSTTSAGQASCPPAYHVRSRRGAAQQPMPGTRRSGR